VFQGACRATSGKVKILLPPRYKFMNLSVFLFDSSFSSQKRYADTPEKGKANMSDKDPELAKEKASAVGAYKKGYEPEATFEEP
jgi:hypothetical protein